MKKISRKPVWILSLALLVPAGGAAAQPNPGDDAQRVRDLFKKGETAYRAGKKQEAYEAYLAAWNVHKSFDIAANLAVVELDLGKSADAANHVSYAIQNFPPSVPAKTARELEDLLKTAESGAGALAILVDKPGAGVLVDASVVGASPLAGPFYVAPGSHTVQARLTGFVTASAQASVVKGVTATVKLELLAEALPPPRITTPPPPPSTDRIGVGWFVAGAALAAGGIGLGVGSTLASNAHASDYAANSAKLGGGGACAPPRDASADCMGLRDSATQRDNWRGLAIAAYVGGGAVGLATAGLWIWDASRSPDRGDHDRAGLRVIPRVVGGYQGLLLEGGF